MADEFKLTPVDYNPFAATSAPAPAPAQEQQKPPQQEAAPSGPFKLTPVDYDPFAQPAKPAEQPGIFGTAMQAAGKGIKSAATAIAQAPTAFNDRPPEEPDNSAVGHLLAQPVYEGWSDPKWWVAHIAHGAAGAAPSLAAGAAGALVGGPAGGIAGFALGSAVGEVAPAYQRARQEGLDHDSAVTRAIAETGVAGGFGALMGASPMAVARVIQRPVSRALAEIFGVMPGIGAAQQVTQNKIEGKETSGSDLATGYAENVGVGLGLVGAGRLLRGRHPAETPPVAGEEKPAAPPEQYGPDEPYGPPQGPRPLGPADFARDRFAHAAARAEQLGDLDRAVHNRTPEDQLAADYEAQQDQAHRNNLEATGDQYGFSTRQAAQRGAAEARATEMVPGTEAPAEAADKAARDDLTRSATGTEVAPTPSPDLEQAKVAAEADAQRPTPEQPRTPPEAIEPPAATPAPEEPQAAQRPPEATPEAPTPVQPEATPEPRPPAPEPAQTPESAAPEATAEKPADYGQSNKLFTQDAAERAREILRRKLSGSQLNTGLDPELFTAGVTLAGYHIEAGARKFADFAKAMVDDIGDSIRPYLGFIYDGLRRYPGMEEMAKELSPHDEVDAEIAKWQQEPNIREAAEPTPENDNGNATVPGDAGVPGAVPSGDGGTGAENAEGPAKIGEPGAVPEGEMRPGEQPLPGDTGEQPAAEHGPGEGGGGAGEGAPDRVPAGEGTNSDNGGGATGRPAGTPDVGEPPRAPDAEVRGTNFVIAPGEVAEGRGPALKARDNIAAIELAKHLIEDGRPATREEQAILAKYVGWGGLSGAFPHPQTGRFAAGLEDVGGRLRNALTPEEYRTAQRSTQYAHYTSEPVVRAMWDAASRLGFEGGSVFEPGMGVGHFLGMMPADLGEKTRYQGIELDHVTSQIAKLLYPESGVRQADYTRIPVPQDAFDMVIGNPPFSDTVVSSDPKYRKNGFVLHDYFFAKSLDAVRPGGLLAFVTSTGTMNKLDPAARKFMAERAEFIGGIRLPNNAFARNAGTEVTTDILFFKKNRFGQVDLGDKLPDWTQTVARTLPGPTGEPTEGRSNRYFSEHPEMVLGQEGFFSTLYNNRGDYSVRPLPDANLTDQLQTALAHLPENVIEPAPTSEERAALDFSSNENKNGTFYVKDGRLMQYRDGAGRLVEQRGRGVVGGVSAESAVLIQRLVPIRDALRDVYRHDLSDNAEGAAEARGRLNKFYDEFVEKHGPINKGVEYTRKLTIIEAETARDLAREEARDDGREFTEGDFDPTDMIDAGASVGDVARARRAARDAAIKAGNDFDEGTFDPEDMPGKTIIRYPNIDPFMADPESYRLRAIEKYDPETGLSEKRRIFRESVLTRNVEPQINSPHDGVMWSLNQFGRLDLDKVSEKMGVDRAQLISDLGELVYRVPGTEHEYHTNSEYLSGDVVTKLDEAKAAAEKNPEFQRNVDALEKVQPEPLTPADVVVSLGMPWIPADAIGDFMRDHLQIGDTLVSYSPAIGKWIVDTKNARYDSGQARWATTDFSAHELLEDALNRTMPKVFRRMSDGSRVFDAVATQAAHDKIDEIKQEFRNWVANDVETTDKLVGMYNDKYNRTVAREWDGSYLTTPGVSVEWDWRPHQTRVIARVVQSGNAYMAHAVGAGKTSAMIGAGMEMRRLGLVKKPMYVVPNHMLGQFSKEFYEQYPLARIMVADEKQFHTDRRRQFVADVSQQDLDAVIITNSGFKKIPTSDAFAKDIIQEQIDELEDAIQAADPKDRITVKQLEKAKEKLEQRLSAGNKNKDQTFTFEELGVDFLFVDEAHQFRKLSFATQQGNIKGIAPKGSDMAFDLYTKIRYLDGNRPGRSVVFASGTPITNTMGELYTISRFLQRKDLAENGINHFDSWAQTFGDTQTSLEQTAQGTYEPVTRFSKFVNIPELYKMVSRVMDIVTPNELAKYVVRPELQEGKRQFHLAPRTEFLDDYQAELAKRVQQIRAYKGKPYPGMDILLSVINDGRLAAIDPRFVDPTIGSNVAGDSKLNTMIDNVHQIWKDTKDKTFYDPATNYETPLFTGPATQMVFSNLGIAGGNGRFSGYQHMRRELIRRGVPENEIAFIRDYNTPIAKQRLFNDMNEGKVRILVGSVQKMGTGVNAQRRLVAVHNLDPLWYPADDEQRNGRILRQGNLNPEIQIHDYSTKGTYDATMWQMMGRKGRFIEQFFRGDPNLREMEDLGEASQYEQASAISTSDERIITLTEMKQELEKTNRRASAHVAEQYGLRRKAEFLQGVGEINENKIAQTEALLARRQDTTGDKFRMAVGDQEFTDRRGAADALTAAADQAPAGNTIVGQIGGFPLGIKKWDASEDQMMGGFRVKGREAGHQWYVSFGKDDEQNVGQPRGNGASAVAGAETRLRMLDTDRQQAVKRNEDAKQQLGDIRSQLGKPFADANKVKPLERRVRQLELQIAGIDTVTDQQQFAETLASGQPVIGPNGFRYQIVDNQEGGKRLLEGNMLRAEAGKEPPMREAATGEQADLVQRAVDTLSDLFIQPEEPPAAPEPVEARGPTRPNTVAPSGEMTEGTERPATQIRLAEGEDHQTARDWVVENGRKTGQEHAATYDPRSGDVTPITGTEKSNITVEHADFDTPKAGIVTHHYHPAGTALSGYDVGALGHPGLSHIIAHGPDGEISVASLTGAAQKWAAKETPEVAALAIRKTWNAAANVINAALRMQEHGGFITEAQRRVLYPDLTNRALAANGLLDYVSNHPTDAIADYTRNSILRRAADTAAKQAKSFGLKLTAGEDIGNDTLNRSSVAVGHDEAMGGLPSANEGRSTDTGGTRGNQGSREGTAGQGGKPKGTALDLREFTNEEIERDLATVHVKGKTPNLIDRATNWWNDVKEDRATRFKQAFLDYLAGLESRVRGATGGEKVPTAIDPVERARAAQNAPYVAAHSVGRREAHGFEGGQVQWNPDKGVVESIPGAKPLVQILAPIFDSKLDSAFAAWMIANRAARLRGEGREHNVDDAFIDKYADLDTKLSAEQGALLRQARDGWREYNKNLLDFGEATGIINKDGRRLWDNDDYVPFYRALDEGVKAPGAGGRGVANVRSPIRRLKGAEEKVGDLYDNMMKNTEAIINRGMKNTAMQAAEDILSGTGIMTPLSRDARIGLTTDEGRARLTALGIDPDTASAEAKDAARNLFGMLRSKDPNVVSVMRNGKPVYYQVEDPLLLRSLVAIGPKEVDGLMKLLTGARLGITRAVMLDPAFMTAHLLRMTTHTYLATGYNVTPGMSTARGIVSSLRSSPSAMALIAGGAVSGQRYRSQVPGELRNAMADRSFGASVLNTPKALFDFVEKVGRASDQANRIAVYEAAVKEGLGDAEAMARARDVLNFSMRGDHWSMNMLVNTVPFLNARLQGLYRSYRGLKDNPSTMLLRGGMMTAASILLWSYNKDNPEYQKLPDWDRQYAWHFFTPFGHFRLPKPFEMGAVFASLPEMMADYSENGRDKQLVTAFVQMMESQLRFDPVPGAIRPIIDVAANRNSLTGAPIVNPAEAENSPPMRYGAHTSSTAIGLGQVTGNMGPLSLGPDQVEYLAHAYAGAVGSYLLAATDGAAEAMGLTRTHAAMRTDQIPVVGRFYHEEPSYQSRWRTEFYNLNHEVTELYKDVERLKKENSPAAAIELTQKNADKLAMRPALTEMQHAMSQLRRQQTAIEMNPAMTAQQKRESEDQLTAAQNRVAERIRPIIQRLEGLKTMP